MSHDPGPMKFKSGDTLGFCDADGKLSTDDPSRYVVRQVLRAKYQIEELGAEPPFAGSFWLKPRKERNNERRRRLPGNR